MAPDEQFTSSRDQIEAENAFLRLKLELEHNLKECGNSEVPPEIENIFLRSVYAFEQKHTNSPENRERPGYRMYSELPPDALIAELQRLNELMRENQIVLECICEYDDGVIYKFFTGELLEKPVDRNVCKEMVIHFTYICP
jgi:hypothetical protein